MNARAGAGAVVAEIPIAQPGEALAIGIVPLGLPQYLAVPVQTVAIELSQNGVGGAGNFPRRVDIFNAYAPDTAFRPRL